MSNISAVHIIPDRNQIQKSQRNLLSLDFKIGRFLRMKKYENIFLVTCTFQQGTTGKKFHEKLTPILHKGKGSNMSFLLKFR